MIVLYCILYEAHLKYGVILEVSTSSHVPTSIRSGHLLFVYSKRPDLMSYPAAIIGHVIVKSASVPELAKVTFKKILRLILQKPLTCLMTWYYLVLLISLYPGIRRNGLIMPYSINRVLRLAAKRCHKVLMPLFFIYSTNLLYSVVSFSLK